MGALMISLDCNHPDIGSFITHKADINKTTGANISVRVDSEFMENALNGNEFMAEFYRPETEMKIFKVYDAKELLEDIANMNWESAEPGLLFWDRICNYNLNSENKEFSYAGVNPCAEEPLPAGGSCLLGSMNLSEYWDLSKNRFDECTFKKDVKIAVKYLNDVLDEGLPLHPLREQRYCVRQWRQIGLGIMGLADLFVKAKIKYGSRESIELSNLIGYHMIWAAIEESIELAKINGSFDNCNAQNILDSDFWKFNIDNNPYYYKIEKEMLAENIKEYGMRNSQLLTCAPTGTISTILNISGGIEPMFALEYTRTTKSLYNEDRVYTVRPKAVQALDTDNLDDVPYLITARDVPWNDRIDVQSAWQKHIDASISSTLNIPEKSTVDDIIDIFTYAYEQGLKGITIYRENCKRGAILEDTSSKKKSEKNAEEQCTHDVTTCKKENKCPDCGSNGALRGLSKNEFAIAQYKKDFKDYGKILTRSDFGDHLHGTTYYKKVACGHIYITINRYGGRPVEVFMQSSKSGGCAANTEALGRLASTMLRANIDPCAVVDSVLGVKCAACSTMKGKGQEISGLSCSDVMARVLKEEYENFLNGKYDNEILELLGDNDKKIPPVENTKIKISVSDANKAQECIDNGICPECGKKLRHSEGCLVCDNCGFSKC